MKNKHIITRKSFSAILFFFMITVFAASAQKPDTVEMPAFKNYTDEQLKEARKNIPGGDNLTNDEIRKRLQAAYEKLPSQNSSQFAVKKDSIITDAAFKNLILQSRGEEVSGLDQKLMVNGNTVKQKDSEYRGTVTEIKDNKIKIKGKEKNQNQEITLDLASTPQLDLSLLKGNRDVKLRHHFEGTPGGNLDGSALLDATGLWFAAERRTLKAGLTKEDMGGFTLTQRKDILKEPAYKTKCSEVYFTPVSVTTGNREEQVSIDHGMQKLVRKGTQYFLIRIINSVHTKMLPCEIALETHPWLLEYSIIRVDDKATLKKFQTDDETIKQNNSPDAPPGKLKGDTPPDPKLTGGDN